MTGVAAARKVTAGEIREHRDVMESTT